MRGATHYLVVSSVTAFSRFNGAWMALSSVTVVTNANRLWFIRSGES